jgi:hypothetical protein
VLGDEAVDFRLLIVGDPKKLLGKVAHFRLNGIAGLPERGANLAGSLMADVGLKQHLHGELAGLAAMA